MSTTTVGVYARVSDGRKQDAENQLVALREYCAKQGWQIVTEFVDQESGGTAKRLEFMRMFEAARVRRFDLLLFWSLDRLSREGARETLNHLQRLTSYGVAWQSFTEQYLNSLGPFGDAVVAILGTIAKQERIRRSERSKAAVEKLRAKGKTAHLGRPRHCVDLAQIRSLRAAGLSWRQVGKRLDCAPALALRRLRAAEAKPTEVQAA